MTEPEARAGANDPSELHSALVGDLVKRGLITTPAVEAAFRAVPRHLFLPDLPLDQVYRDQAIPTKYENGMAISSSSQPAIMAIMLEQLAAAPGQRVLEIGAGTGYNAALLAQLVGPSGSVVTLDFDDDIVAGARAHLASAGAAQVRVVQQDGALGYPAFAPYDRIMLTVGAWDVVPAWREQLAHNGRLVLPLTLLPGLMLSVALEPAGAGLKSVSARPCGFMPLRGQSAHPATWEWASPQISVVPKTTPQPAAAIEFTLEKAQNIVRVAWPAGPSEEKA